MRRKRYTHLHLCAFVSFMYRGGQLELCALWETASGQHSRIYSRHHWRSQFRVWCDLTMIAIIKDDVANFLLYRTYVLKYHKPGGTFPKNTLRHRFKLGWSIECCKVSIFGSLCSYGLGNCCCINAIGCGWIWPRMCVTVYPCGYCVLLGNERYIVHVLSSLTSFYSFLFPISIYRAKASQL